MKRFFALPATVLALLITGCATNYGNKSSAEVAAALAVKDSAFDSVIAFSGPPVFSSTSRGLFEDNQTIRLAAAQSKETKEIKYAVYVSILYGLDWRFYESVSFKDGTKTNLIIINRKVNSCTGIGCLYTEEVMFPIDLDRLNKPGNLEFRLNSKSGKENIITLGRAYIDGVLQSVRSKTGAA